MQDRLGRVPPNSLDAEKSLLGALMISRDAMVEIADVVNPEMFYSPAHRDIYEAIRGLYEAREPIDNITVSNSLRAAGKLESVGGVSYLVELVEGVPTAAHAVGYSKIIKAAYVRRSMMETAAKISELAVDEETPIEEVLDAAEKGIFSLSQSNLKGNFTHIRVALNESFDRLDLLGKNEGGVRGVPTGYKDLDDTLAGLQQSNLIILAARPGVGKTSFALNIAHNAAVKYKVPIGFFSLEMSQVELADRLIVQEGNIDAWKLKTGNMNDEEFTRYSEALGVLADSPVYIDDTPGISILEMRTKARRLQLEYGVKMIVVDYLQLATGGSKYESRTQEVGAVSQGLKNLARELKVPVLALAQLSRAYEQRGTKTPQLSDLRESGSIEQDADVVMFLYREADDNLEDYKLSIAKHRNGGLRVIDLKFRGDRVRFYGVERRPGEVQA